MAYNIAPVISRQFFDDNGDPLAGGLVYSYQAGTTTPLVTYSDSSGTPNSNPVVLDSEGRCSIWIDDNSYKFVVKTAAGTTITTEDNVSSPVPNAIFSTGDAKLTFKNVADSGWIMADDKSIGSSASGATGRANSDTEDLYILLWNNIADSWAPVSSGRGASASLDFAANKTLTLPRSLGRALAISGAGSTLTSRALGEYLGAETHTLQTTEIPSHTHTFTGDAHTHTQNSHTHQQAAFATSGGGSSTGPAYTVTANNESGVNNTNATTATNQNTTATGTNSNTGGGGSHNNMQPTSFWNVMIKL